MLPAGDGGDDRRLHAASPLFRIVSIAKGFLLPVVAVLFVSRGVGYDFFAALFIIPAAVAALAHYFVFRYRLEREELVLRSGLLFRRERSIPYNRIQNIDLVQGPLHRLFQVAEVRLETASGSEPEGVMQVLSLEAVEELRRSVFATGGPQEPSEAAASAPPLVAMSPAEVVRFGLVSNRGIVVVGAALGVLWQLDLMDRWWEGLGQQLERWTPAVMPETSGVFSLTNVLAVLGLAVAGVGLLVLLSVLVALVRLYGFRLERHGDDLRARYGLLTRVTATVPVGRIQLLSVREGALHRRMGRQSVMVESAGAGSELGEDDGKSRQPWIAPLIARGRTTELVRRILPEIDLDAVPWQPLARGAKRRYLVALAVIVLLPTAAVAFALRPWGWALLPVMAAWVTLHVHLWLRHTGWAVTDSAVFFRSGWWSRRTSAVRFSKIQTVRLTRSPFDRRRDMANVAVDTAGAGKVGHKIDIPYLDFQTARNLAERLYDEVAQTRFRW